MLESICVGRPRQGKGFEQEVVESVSLVISHSDAKWVHISLRAAGEGVVLL